MKAWVLLDTATIPGGGGDLRLLQRDAEFSIRLQDGVLMGSRARGSEQALATSGCAPIRDRVRARVLVGGFGMGFTLRAALDTLDETAEVVVAELVAAVLTWGRGPLSGLSANSLADSRVRVHEGDVGRLIAASSGAFDAILLDVDNGPDGLTRDANDGLYGFAGLRATWTALRAGGVLAVWSAAPDQGFAQRLRTTGFAVEEIVVRAHGKAGRRHLIWVATKSGSPKACGGHDQPQDHHTRTRRRAG